MAEPTKGVAADEDGAQTAKLIAALVRFDEQLTAIHGRKRDGIRGTVPCTVEGCTGTITYQFKGVRAGTIVCTQPGCLAARI